MKGIKATDMTAIGWSETKPVLHRGDLALQSLLGRDLQAHTLRHGTQLNDFPYFGSTEHVEIGRALEHIVRSLEHSNGLTMFLKHLMGVTQGRVGSVSCTLPSRTG